MSMTKYTKELVERMQSNGWEVDRELIEAVAAGKTVYTTGLMPETKIVPAELEGTEQLAGETTRLKDPVCGEIKMIKLSRIRISAAEEMPAVRITDVDECEDAGFEKMAEIKWVRAQ